MSDKKTDSIIKESLKMLQKEPKEMSFQCPPDEKLADYVNGIVSEGFQDEDITRHITECDSCFSRTASAVSALTSFDKSIPVKGDVNSVRKAKSIPRIYGKSKTKGKYMKRNKFLFIAAVFFVLSFIFRAYFLQFLVAASIFGLKWVMDTGGSKALIMIYDTWQQKKGPKPEEEKKAHRRI